MKADKNVSNPQKSETCHQASVTTAKVTIKDIAARAGCAHSIVSNVLNNSGRRSRVSEEKRELIQRIALELGYRSNLNAKRLVGKSTRMIGVLAARNLSPIASDFVMCLTHFLSEYNYSTMLTSCQDVSSELAAINNFVDLGFDGIVTTFLGSPLRAKDIPVPTVFVGYNQGQSDVNMDFQYGEYLAVKHLIAHGHQKVGFLCDRLNGNMEKYHGYLDALQEQHIAPDPEWVIQTYANKDFEKQLWVQIKDRHLRAFVVTGDELAARLMRYLQQHGVSVPRDVAVIGCDANFSVLLTTPTLTSIVYPAHKIAIQTVELLFERIKNPEICEYNSLIGIKPKLFLGGSCGCKDLELRDIGYHYPSSRTIDYYMREPYKEICNDFRFEE